MRTKREVLYNGADERWKDKVILVGLLAVSPSPYLSNSGVHGPLISFTDGCYTGRSDIYHKTTSPSGGRCTKWTLENTP